MTPQKSHPKMPQTAQTKNSTTTQTIAIVVGLLAWVGFCIYFSQFLSKYLFLWLVQTFHFELTTTIDSIYYLFINLLTILIMFGVPALLRKKFPKLAANPLFEKPTREELGLRELPTWTDILLSPIGFIIYIAASHVVVDFFAKIFPWFNATERQDVYSNLSTFGDKILAFIVVAIAVPIIEEVIFRGFLYGRLRKYLNLPLSMLLVSLLFAALHGQWNVRVDVFILSLALCGLREITGTAYAGILIHIIKNSIALYYLIVLSGTPAYSAILPLL